MAENVLQNIQNIELGSYVLDSSGESVPCIIFRTMMKNYCFRLDSKSPLESYITIFNLMAADLNTPVEKPTEQPQEAPAEEVTKGEE